MRTFDKTLTRELKDEEIDLEKGWLDEGEYITIVPEQRDEDGNIIVYEHEETERVKIYFTFDDIL